MTIFIIVIIYNMKIFFFQTGLSNIDASSQNLFFLLFCVVLLVVFNFFFLSFLFFVFYFKSFTILIYGKVSFVFLALNFSKKDF